MCEGNMHDVQVHLQDQQNDPGRQVKTNILMEVVLLLEYFMEGAIQTYTEKRMDDLTPLVIQALHFLQEAMLGPYETNPVG